MRPLYFQNELIPLRSKMKNYPETPPPTFIRIKRGVYVPCRNAQEIAHAKSMKRYNVKMRERTLADRLKRYGV